MDVKDNNTIPITKQQKYIQLHSPIQIVLSSKVLISLTLR